MKILGSYPKTRLRRVRKSDWIRRLISENDLSVNDLILPVFIKEGKNLVEPIKSMPGINRYSLDKVNHIVDKACKIGIPMIALFPETPGKKKDAYGSEALNENNLVCKSLRDYGIKNHLDVHLMVEPVDDLIKMFADAGASSITFHPEASKDPEKSLSLISDLGCKPGLVVNPDISLDVLNPYIEDLYMVLLMSVFPGFGGQAFIPEVLDKISELRKTIDGLNKEIRLEIDGGVKVDNISKISESGADTFVAGSAIFNEENYKDTITKFKSLID